MYHNGKQIIIDFIRLPEGINGITQERGKSYVVLINSLKPEAVQQHAIGHELCHIFRNHFDSGKPLEAFEKEADSNAAQYYQFYAIYTQTHTQSPAERGSSGK